MSQLSVTAQRGLPSPLGEPPPPPLIPVPWCFLWCTSPLNIWHLFVFCLSCPAGMKPPGWQGFAYIVYHWVPGARYIGRPQEILVGKMMEWIYPHPEPPSELAAACLFLTLRWIRLQGLHTHWDGVYFNFPSSSASAFGFWWYEELSLTTHHKWHSVKTLDSDSRSIHDAVPPSPASLGRRSSYFRKKNWDRRYVKIFTWDLMLGTKNWVE